MKSMLHKSFNPAKCKTAVKMAESRIKLLKNKRATRLTQLKREVAQLLSSGQNQTAMIRVEHVVREEKTIAAYDLIEIYCELIVARLSIIQSQKICPIDLKEAVTSIIFAAPRCADIPELKDASKHFTAKYGKEFVSAAVEIRPECGVNRILVEKLSAKAPDGPTKVKILTAIAEENNIKWEANWFEVKEQKHPFPYLSSLEKDNKSHMEPTDFQAAPSFDPKPRVSSNTLGTVPNFQAASNFEPRQGVSSSGIHTVPSFDPIHGVSSNIHDHARSEWNSSNTVLSGINNSGRASTAYHASSSGTGSDAIRSNQSATKLSDAPFEGRPKYNMGFKDATDAANAAARSAEEASRAARAAAELASHRKNMNDAYNDSDYTQNEDYDGYNDAAFRDEPVGKKSMSYSPPERNPRMEEHMQRDASRHDKTSEIMTEDSFRRYHNHSVRSSRHNSFEQGSPGMQSEQKENVRASIARPTKDYYQEEFQSDTKSKSAYIFPESDSRERTRPYSAEPGETTSYLDYQREHASVDNPFFEQAVETKSSSSRSQYSDLSEDYDVFNSNDPKFDDDPHEDPFAAFHERNVLKEDWEIKESSSHITAAHWSDVYNQKDTVFSESEQNRYGFEPSKDSFVGTVQGSTSMEKDYMHNDTSVGAVFDDYGSDDDVNMIKVAGKEDTQSSVFQNPSPGENSACPSSPDHDKSTRSWERQSSTLSKHLYQPELTESFKNSPLFSQLDRPLHLNSDDSNDDEDALKSKGGKKLGSLSAYHDSPEPEPEPKPKPEPDSRALREFTESSHARRGTSGIPSDPLATKQLSEEGHQLGSVNPMRERFGSSDIYASQQSYFNSLDHQSLSSEEDDEEDQRQSPGLTDDQSHIESTPKLNMESWPRGRRNVGYFRPPFTKDPSVLISSVSPRHTLDVTPKASQLQAASPFIEQVEPSNQSESSSKKNSSLRLHSAGYYPEENDDRYLEEGSRKSRSRCQEAYFDSERPGSRDDGPKETLPRKGGRAGPGVSRRTRASQKSVSSFEPGLSHVALSFTKESVPEKESSSAISYTASERAELLRWTEELAGYNSIHQPNNSGGEENLKPSVDVKQATHSGDRRSGGRSTRTRRTSTELPRTEAEADYKPTQKPKLSLQEENLRPLIKEKKLANSKGEALESVAPMSGSTEEAPSRDNSMKKAGYVHPKLPDFDTLADRIRSLNMERK